jgi:outer membrane protein TolC
LLTTGLRQIFVAVSGSALLGSAIWLTGCANLTGQALSTEEIQSQVQADRQSLGRDVAPLTGPVSLEEAIARAIKYNAAQRLRGMEEAVAQGTANVAKFDMLPAGGLGRLSLPRQGPDQPQHGLGHRRAFPGPSYISSDRESTLTSLSFSWSLLDFGQSYYAARQHADRAQIAAERRRKAIPR